uniref:Uncharacterized protein n=1 Tax=Eptatretus burgeri TaxID=7764 RepID=A0A8C4Q4H4_EPTBU
MIILLYVVFLFFSSRMMPMMPSAHGIPPVLHHSVPPGIPGYLPHPGMLPVSSQPNGPCLPGGLMGASPPGLPPPSTKPLFPSVMQAASVQASGASAPVSASFSSSSKTAQAVAVVSSPAMLEAGPKPLISPAEPAVVPVNKISLNSATCRLVHPDEDISLEEKRAQVPKYHQPVPSPAPPGHGAVPQLGPRPIPLPQGSYSYPGYPLYPPGHRPPPRLPLFGPPAPRSMHMPVRPGGPC